MSLISVLMKRDNISEEEATKMIDYCKDLVAGGEDPYEVIQDELGLEPDYILELL